MCSLIFLKELKELNISLNYANISKLNNEAQSRIKKENPKKNS